MRTFLRLHAGEVNEITIPKRRATHVQTLYFHTKECSPLPAEQIYVARRMQTTRN
jgi:hypothetical protein